jgi:ComF family protein
MRSLIELLFPARCVGCRTGGWPFCASCWAWVAALDPPWCQRCGRPLEASLPGCSDCPPPAVSWARSAFLYAGPVREALMSLKFGGLRSATSAFAPWMAEALSRAPPQPGGKSRIEDATLTWVPLWPGRRRRRGFDQAEALARAVAANAGMPVRRLLARTRDTAPQAQRAGVARRRALQGAFQATGTAPQLLVLVDDVLTSGATAAECARVLKRAGAREVGLLTAARSLGHEVPGRCYNPRGLRSGSVVARETASRKSMPVAGETTHVR